MSKNEIVKASDATNVIDKLYGGMETFLNAAKSKQKFAKLIQTESSRQVLATSLASFTAIDARFEGGMKNVGKICVAILGLETAAQLLAINAIAKTNGLSETKDGGRKGLAYAFFGRYPEMSKMSGKDTLAGKRLSSYIAAAKDGKKAGGTGKKAGRPTGPQTPGTGSQLPEGNARVATAQSLFVALFTVADDKGKDLLITLCQKAKIEYEDWVEVDEAENVS
jgi:hypothetical protein